MMGNLSISTIVPQIKLPESRCDVIMREEAEHQQPACTLRTCTFVSGGLIEVDEAEASDDVIGLTRGTDQQHQIISLVRRV